MISRAIIDSRSGIRVKELIEAECLLSGTLSRGDLAFEGLDQWVHGYRIGRAGPLRQALEPLRSAWPFDVVQSGYQLVFRERGTLGPVTTIPASDLDARPGGAARGVSLTTRRETAGQLPRRVVVQYLEGPREYEPGEQYAERLVTPGVGERIVELPIVMTADEAAQTAETLLYLAWLEERSELAFTVPASYAQLEPGDRVDLELPQGTVAVRLSAITLTSDGRLECRAAYARRTVYQPGAYGASAGVTGPGVRPPAGPTRYVLLDLPMVLAAQSGPSYLCALYGDLPGWRGGMLMRSPDGGSTWASVFDDGPPGPAVGVVTNVPGIVDARIEDRRSALKVTLLNGALYSVSDGQIDVGGNLFAYGDDGRWEILSARECDRISASDYLLTVLRRGRYGTEWAMAQHQVGDKLVRLDPADLALIDTPSAEIGQRYLYRGITDGQDIGSDIDRPFRYVGVNLKPLAPVYLTGSRDSGQDWSLSWVRRTRDGGEWRDYVDAGLGESAESYQVEIYSDAGFTSVRRRIVGSAPWCVYPSADQIADFGAPQSTLHLRVCQLSPVVGPGYPLQATLSR
ncbi:phage tail protein [Accumulibacter sp.]|uniref:phage tail protein n=1 Tax=Accumulibacter sp. TaxID=2053492 RepID=UPI0025F02E27|nr:phage tail protein [Accumulibacter sp.]MCM8594028.1 phage tail protein [Accumulibacter sp.]MDS4048171.1 phage tail protein [Accumulibacter sp.]